MQGDTPNATLLQCGVTISDEEKAFFIALGERITRFRKARGITQVQLAEILGVSQQTIQAYEVGRRRIQVSALPIVAHTLTVSLDALFGETEQRKRNPALRLQRQIEAICQLPKARQRFVSEMLDAVLAQSRE